MRRFTTGFALIAFLLAGANSLMATTEYANILIIEVQTASAESSSDEFVELFNPNDQVIDLEGLLLQYRSASGSSWLKKATLSGQIEPRGRFLVGTYGQVSHEMSTGLASGGGHVRIYDEATETTQDKIGWGSALDSEGFAAVAADAGQSLKRMLDEDGFFVDTNNNSLDMFVSETPTPQFDQQPEIIEEDPEPESESDAEEGQEEDTEQDETTDEQDVDETEEEVSEPPVVVDKPAQYAAKLVITELFIDPEKPQTDAEDEFVEIQNLSSETVSLEGYTIQTGNDYRYSFTIPDIGLLAGEHLAFYSIDTGLILSNSSGGARLLDPNQDVVFETAPYDNAKGGVSWAISSDGNWGWAAIPTPDAPNATELSTTATLARQVAREVSKSTSRATSTGSIKSGSGSSSDDVVRDIYVEPEEEPQNEVNNRLLAGMGGLTVLYAGYEYRRDLGNRIYQIRRYFAGRR